ncbi:hypothetical protein [Paenibacillus luteus]|uniref:hypothetical protein n=1 Tax=Paenibacillus luteus TaxID=2545753 RepID=UPI0019D54FE8|nr:hypothetical protein [Paenibacillus luteus]
MNALANEQEIQEIKRTLKQLEDQIVQIKKEARKPRSFWSRFAIGFLIVFIGMLMASGVLSFFQYHK